MDKVANTLTMVSSHTPCLSSHSFSNCRSHLLADQAVDMNGRWRHYCRILDLPGPWAGLENLTCFTAEKRNQDNLLILEKGRIYRGKGRGCLAFCHHFPL